ncbi:MAG: macrolide family glycosyltransferase [Clostridiales bacterium]
MANVLYVNGHAQGHINPTLSLVRELVKKGEDVYYTTTKEYKEIIENTGCKTIIIDEYEIFIKKFNPKFKHPFYYLIESILEYNAFLIPLILKKIEHIQIDYVLHDSVLGGGNIISNKLKKPGICISTTFVLKNYTFIQKFLKKGSHPELELLEKRIDEYEKDLNIGKVDILDLFFEEEDLNIVFTSKEFHPPVEFSDKIFKFIGPSIGERKEMLNIPLDFFESENKTIYISMGTINNDLPEFYNLCIETFKDSKTNIILSVGEKIDMKMFSQKIPNNFIIKNYVSQLEILKKVDGFISHGGFNSVSESILNEVPLVVIPRLNDQFIIGKRVEELGVGILLKNEELNRDLLGTSVDKILKSKMYKDNCKKIKNSFNVAGGAEKGVEYITEFIKNLNS